MGISKRWVAAIVRFYPSSRTFLAKVRGTRKNAELPVAKLANQSSQIVIARSYKNSPLVFAALLNLNFFLL